MGRFARVAVESSLFLFPEEKENARAAMTRLFEPRLRRIQSFKRISGRGETERKRQGCIMDIERVYVDATYVGFL